MATQTPMDVIFISISSSLPRFRSDQSIGHGLSDSKVENQSAYYIFGHDVETRETTRFHLMNDK
jgi:hypothetical protein